MRWVTRIWYESALRRLSVLPSGSTDKALDTADADAILGCEVALLDSGSERRDQRGALIGGKPPMQRSWYPFCSVLNGEHPGLAGTPRRA